MVRGSPPAKNGRASSSSSSSRGQKYSRLDQAEPAIELRSMGIRPRRLLRALTGCLFLCWVCYLVAGFHSLSAAAAASGMASSFGGGGTRREAAAAAGGDVVAGDKSHPE